jgi:predicted dehydrogenase
VWSCTGRGYESLRFLDPASGEAAQLDALARQAAAFARYVRGGACEGGATVGDAVAALEAAAGARTT